MLHDEVYGIAAFSTCETFAEAFGWGYQMCIRDSIYGLPVFCGSFSEKPTVVDGFRVALCLGAKKPDEGKKGG